MAKVEAVRNLELFLKNQLLPEGVFIVSKRQIRKCDSIRLRKNNEPDFIVFRHRDGEQKCFVIELKDGDQFDTKKALAEKTAIDSFINEISPQLPCRVTGHFCCFNQNDRNTIVDGFKKKITLDEAMTGREFCELLEIDYDEIVTTRTESQPVNITFFLSELIRIKAIRKILRELLGNNDYRENDK